MRNRRLSDLLCCVMEELLREDPLLFHSENTGQKLMDNRSDKNMSAQKSEKI